MTGTGRPENTVVFPAWSRVPTEAEDVQVWNPMSAVDREAMDLAWGPDGAMSRDEANASAADSPEDEECPLCEETREEAAKQHDGLMTQFQESQREALQSYEESLAQLNEQFGQNVIRLARILVERILARTVTIAPDVTTDALVKALTIAGPLHRVTVAVHPDMVDGIRSDGVELASNISGQAVDVTVKADPEIELGGVRIIHDDGVVDATFDTQLQRLDELVSDISRKPSSVSSTPEEA
jgi:flagellar biosynthesis/type III secretory pathway protein FliH